MTTLASPDEVAGASVAGTPSAARIGTSAGLRVAAEGARDITPMVIGVIPFGLAIGAAIGASGLGTAEGLASGPVILAGAAQLSTVQMLDGGAAAWVIIVSALMINARLLLYSASLAPWFQGAPLRHRLLLAVPVIDQMHFTCAPRFERGDLDRNGRIAYYVGAAAWLCSAWVVTQLVAIVVGAQVPDAVGLHVAAPLALAGLLAKSLTDSRSYTAALVGAVVAVAAVGLPFHSAVLAAIVAGIGAGVVVDVRDRRRAARVRAEQRTQPTRRETVS